MIKLQEILYRVVNELLIEAASLEDLKQKYYSNIDDNTFNEIVQADPTYRQDTPNKMGQYTKWLLNIYRKKNLKIEDLYKATEYLEVFDKAKRMHKLANADINKYKTLSELYNEIKKFYSKDDELISQKDMNIQTSKDASKVFDNGKWIVIIPHTRNAAIKYGKGTQWCTSATTSDNYFDEYNEQGELYIVIDRQSNRKWQFHFETKSFKDENDRNINKTEFFRKNDKDGTLMSFFKKERPNDYLYLKYNHIGKVYEGWATFQRDDYMWSYINDEGKLIGNGNAWFKQACDFHEGWARVQREDGKWSLINDEGKLIGNGNAWFKQACDFHEGWAEVQREDGKWSLINDEGKLIGNGNAWFNRFGLSYGEWIEVQRKDGKWSLINDEGKLIGNGNMWFDSFKDFYNGWAKVQREDGKWSFINKNGKLIGNGKAWFDDAYDFYNTLTIGGRGYDYFYIDTNEILYDKNKNLIGNLNDNETLRKAGLDESKTRYVRLTESELRQVIGNIIENCILIF